MSRNLLAAVCAIGILGFGVFLLLQNSDSEEVISPVDTEIQIQDEVEAPTTIQDTEVSEEESVVDKYEGTHIMPDGTVMAKDGTIYADAVILVDGTIRLGDGTVITPIADFRASTDSSTSVAHEAPHVVIDVAGVDFEYDVKEIKVKKGDTVTINFKSDEGFHDWVVDEFSAATKRVNEGGETSVTFVADKVGTFQFYCSVMSHREMGMVGYLVVE